MDDWLKFLLGVGVGGAIAYGVYKIAVEPTIDRQQKTNQILGLKIQELELRIHELE